MIAVLVLSQALHVMQFNVMTYLANYLAINVIFYCRLHLKHKHKFASKVNLYFFYYAKVFKIYSFALGWKCFFCKFFFSKVCQ